MTTTTQTRFDRSLGFTSQEEETKVDALPVAGELPRWLKGTLVRVTPAKLEAGGERLRHWFDGLAMLNAFSVADGRASYGSRFLEGRVERRVRGEGRWPAVGGFAQDPCRNIFKRVSSLFSGELDNCNVNLARIGERYIAMTETPIPVEFDPGTLATLGALKYEDSLGGQVTTAHPHHDPERGELVNYVAHMGPRNQYRVYGLPAGSRGRRPIASVPVKEPAYMHSFAITERYVVLAEFPLVVDPLRLAFSGKAFIENYRWKPERGTRFLVIDRERGELVATCEGEPFFAFHHVNAFERGDELVLDVCAYEDDQIIRGFYLDEDGPVGPIPFSELRRYTLSPGKGTAERQTIAPGSLELPRIDYGRRNGRDYRYAYFAGAGLDSFEAQWFDRLAKVDVHDGGQKVWREDGCLTGEPVFVHEPGAEAEDAGVVLSVVLDSRAGRSFLLVLDASSFEELARAEAPHHIPFGFHGQFFGAS